MDGTQDTANTTSLVGTLLFGKLRVDSVLGRGGMGTVYRVTHLGTHHQRALKVMNPQIRMHEDALARFLREATVSGTLKSPHVVETLDSGQLPDGSFYVLMELLEGLPLEDIVGAGPMKLPRIAKLLRQACSALALAHDKGIVHRDIKPDNLFVVKAGEGGEYVKILDFGIARFRQQTDVLGQLTGENAILGTPLYMAPEQIGNANTVDGRADVYALGVVLYEALSGRKPYTAESFAELVAHIFDGRSTPLERTAPGLTPRAYEVVRKAMARKPEDRFQSVSELGEALLELEQPFRPPDAVAPDPLGKTAASIAPPPAPSIPAPTPGPSEQLPPTESSGSRPSRLPWILAAASALGLSLLLARPFLGDEASDAGSPTRAGIAASPLADGGSELRDAGTDAPSAGPVDAGLADAGPADAGLDPLVPASTRPLHRRDAGRAHVPGGLAGPDEIFGVDE